MKAEFSAPVDLEHSSTLPWWKSGVIYHAYLRSFADADGDGQGDLRGLVDRLDYLNDGTSRSLGVSAIWLSPIYLDPGRDVGYDVADHTAIDPAYEATIFEAEANVRAV